MDTNRIMWIVFTIIIGSGIVWGNVIFAQLVYRDFWYALLAPFIFYMDMMLLAMIDECFPKKKYTYKNYRSRNNSIR